MIKDFNEFYVEASINITNETLEQRRNVIANMCKNINGDDICELVRIYYGLICNEDFYDNFAQHFINGDPNFSVKNAEEIKLLAGATLVNIIESKTDLRYLTELLIITISFYHQPNSSRQIQSRIIEQFHNDRKHLRKAENIKDTTTEIINSLIEKFPDDEWQDDLIELLQEEHKRNNELLNVLQIYREDSQILWWMNSQWSNTLNCPLKSLSKEQACIIIGFEAAEMIEKYPGPYSIDAVLKNVIKASKGSASKISIDKALSNADAKWKDKIVSRYKNISFIELLPIHAAICREYNTTAKEQWYPKYKQDILLGQEFKSCGPDEYPFRMFLEVLALKLYLKLKGGK